MLECIPGLFFCSSLGRECGDRWHLVKNLAACVSVYSATKFALEALSDAVRMELAPFGIQVVLIEPGNIRTNFMATAQANSQDILTNPNSPSHAILQHNLRVMTTVRKQEARPEVVSSVVQQAIEASTPKARYLVAVPFAQRVVLHLGDAARDALFMRMSQIGQSPIR